MRSAPCAAPAGITPLLVSCLTVLVLLVVSDVLLVPVRHDRARPPAGVALGELVRAPARKVLLANCWLLLCTWHDCLLPTFV